MTISIEQQNSETRRVTLAGLVINLFLTVIKIVAGVYGNSQSVIADGIHSLSDSATDVAVLVGLKYWNEPPDLCHPYGVKDRIHEQTNRPSPTRKSGPATEALPAA